MAGLLGAGQYYRNSANDLWADAAASEQRRNQVNKQIQAQGEQSKWGLAGTGAGIGAQVGGPWGALIGAGVGLLAGNAFEGFRKD